MTTISNRIITALAAPMAAAGILAGGMALATVAPAVASAQTCITTGSAGVTPNSINPLTRPAQVNAIQLPTHVFAPPSSCIGN